MNRKETLQSAIDRAARIYYYTGQSVFSDDQFDAMIKELQTIDPNDIRVTRVGAPVPAMFVKVKNRATTNSLTKVDTEEDLRDWYKKNAKGGSNVVELKADGSSIFVYYVDGVIDQVLTRGGDDGIGQDVTRNAMKFKGIPHVLKSSSGIIKFTGVVRGEALLTYEDYKKIDPLMSGQIRNIGTGIINRGDGTDSELITFMAFNYEVLEGGGFDSTDEISKLATLELFGFIPMVYRLCQTIDEAIQYWREVDVKRKTGGLSHQIDGLVFKINDTKVAKALGMSSNRPNSERVLKFEAPGAVTKLIGFTGTVGHTGVQKPTADLAPVVIDNTTVKSAQLNNWEIIAALDVAIGDTVYVRKARDIIPEIVEVLERPADRVLIPEPETCFICGGKAGRIELTGGGTSAQTYCLAEDCSAKSIKRIENWITKNRILHLGNTILEALVEKFEMQSPADLYRMTAEGMAGVEIGNGILGIKNATKIYDNIQGTRKMSLNNFLGSLGIRHLGRRMTQLTRERAAGKLETLDDWRSGKFLDLDCGMPGKGTQIMEDIVKYQSVIDDLLQYVEIIPDAMRVVQTTSGILSGKTYVFTGKIKREDPSTGKVYLRSAMQAKVVENGGLVDDKIKVSTPGNQYVLVQADSDSTTSKTKDAKAKGALIISEDEFWATISQSSLV